MANARDELKELEKVVIEDHYKDGWNITLGEVYEEKCIHIDEYLQALEIIVKKNVDIYSIKVCINVEHYNSVIKSKNFNNNYSYEIWYELTDEEYELVRKVVKEIGEDESK